VRCLEVLAVVCTVYHLSQSALNEQTEVTNIPEMNVEHHLLDRLKGRLRIAKEIDSLQHRESKAAHDKKWIRETAEALDIELDSDYQSEYVGNLYFSPVTNLVESKLNQ
jgi:hypothetical protein